MLPGPHEGRHFHFFDLLTPVSLLRSRFLGFDIYDNDE